MKQVVDGGERQRDAVENVEEKLIQGLIRVGLRSKVKQNKVKLSLMELLMISDRTHLLLYQSESVALRGKRRCFQSVSFL